MLTELRLSGMWRSGVLIYQIHPTFPFSGTSGEEGASTSVVRTGCWSHRPELWTHNCQTSIKPGGKIVAAQILFTGTRRSNIGDFYEFYPQTRILTLVIKNPKNFGRLRIFGFFRCWILDNIKLDVATLLNLWLLANFCAIWLISRSSLIHTARYYLLNTI